jgi:hypothetical protein
LELGSNHRDDIIIVMAKKQIKSIKENARSFEPEQKRKYLSGVRDGMDLSALIAEDNEWPLASNKMFRAFLDWLDSQ